MKSDSLENKIDKIGTESVRHTEAIDKLSLDVTDLKQDVTDLKKQTSRIGLEVVKHTEEIGKLRIDVTDLKEKSSRLIDGQDKMIAILQRLDQERLFTFERVKSIENEAEKQRKEINKIKEILKV